MILNLILRIISPVIIIIAILVTLVVILSIVTLVLIIHGRYKSKKRDKEKCTPTTCTHGELELHAASENEAAPSDNERDKIAQKTHHKWRQIGMELRIDTMVLDQIAHVFGSDFQCCSELFRKWAASELTDAIPFTWRAVIDALESSTVDEKDLARQLQTTDL